MMIVINLLGILLLLFIVWWFWLSRPRSHPAERQMQGGAVIEIEVAHGVYTPSIIEVDQGHNLRLRFIRRDPNPCAEVVLFDGLGIRLELPLGVVQEQLIHVDHPGEYIFHCDMNMYRGYLIVK